MYIYRERQREMERDTVSTVAVICAANRCQIACVCWGSQENAGLPAAVVDPGLMNAGLPAAVVDPGHVSSIGITGGAPHWAAQYGGRFEGNIVKCGASN